MATCKDCDCDNFREELLSASDKMIHDGNCVNCGHAVNRHPRQGAAMTAVAYSSPQVHSAHAVSSVPPQGYYQVGQMVDAKVPSAPHYPSAPGPLGTPAHSTDHIPSYQPSRGGYVTGTGEVTGNTTSGDYNDYGRTGVGVNHTVESQGDVAYGGALGAPYGDPYSVRRSAPSSVTSASVSSVESITISPINATASGYGDPYSVKRS